MGSLLRGDLEEELVRFNLGDHITLNEKLLAKKRASRAEYSARGFLPGMGRAWWSPPSIASAVIAGSANHTSAIQTGIPAQRKSNDVCEAKADIRFVL